ncbi:MAG: hypothetical protein HXY45_21680, partial [Syntrophaceae bacterium]|nr:hypothetical protein [Syntrophaceae bacterium]
MVGISIPLLAVFWLFSWFNGEASAEARSQPLLVTSSTVIDRDLEFDSTAFVVKGSNIVIDLGGRTIKFNNGNVSEVANRDFEHWSGNRPISWTVVSGSTSAVPATYFGSLDLNLSPGGSIRSDPIVLKGGKTYLAFAFVKGPNDGSATLRIRRASDGGLLSEKTLSGWTLSRGYASQGSPDGDLQYKPTADI